jgi:rod shape-determining protein MreC
LEHSPPPFFKRGPAPLALLSLYVALTVSMMIVDLRFHYLAVIRDVVAAIVQPLQVIVQVPARGWLSLRDYLAATGELRSEAAALRDAREAVGPQLLRLEQLEAENARLRRLLDLKAREPAAGAAVRVLHATRDPFVHRIIIDQGLDQGVVPGQGIIDEAGLVGQVTRVLPLSSEVTLLTDKTQVTPVQFVRTGLRTIAYGIGRGRFELRYLPAGADIEVGDLLVTSGLDGVYVPGLPVARITTVQREGTHDFARVLAAPVAGIEHFGEVILLAPPSPVTGRHADFGKTAEELLPPAPRGKRRRSPQP